MENKEFAFKGLRINGFVVLLIDVLVVGSGIFMGLHLNDGLIGFVLIFMALFLILSLMGLFSQEPNEARVMVFFGKYKGTFRETGFYWINPFISRKKLSLRARNLDIAPIKVNDKIGNPILIGLVLVWKIKDSYKAMFDIDSENIVSEKVAQRPNAPASLAAITASRMKAFESFVAVQSDAALRQVAGEYAYDNTDHLEEELTLRSGGDEINDCLEKRLNERLAMAGMEIVEARINYLAYAPEIAAVMLRRQQATAIIAAREKIVDGAVSMVKMALEKLSKEDVIELDDEKKAAMASNLLVVLCADEPAQPVINSGTLNH